MRRLTIRLSDFEWEALDDIAKSEVRGDLDKSSMVRLLIHREFNRRHSLSKPVPADFDGSFRRGRPCRTQAKTSAVILP